MTKKKVDVIYISGVGRSGSTILDLIFGSDEKTFSAGELKYLPDFLRCENSKDRCVKDFVDDSGEKLEASLFWGSISREIIKKKIALHERSEFFIKIKTIIRVLFNTTKKGVVAEEEEVFQMIKNKAVNLFGDEITYIVDSSKDLIRLINLDSSPNINLKVVHIIRDARGVVYSNIRRKGKVYLKNKKDGRNWILALCEWIVINILTQRYIKNNFQKKDFITIRYESFAENPQLYFDEINKKFNLNINVEKSIKKINNSKSYRFAGNQLRNEKISGIKASYEWKKEMHPLLKLIVGLVSRPIYSKLVDSKQNKEKIK